MTTRKQSCPKFALQPFFRAQCLLELCCAGRGVTQPRAAVSLPLDSQNERKEDAAGRSFLVVSQHRLSKQKAFLVQRAPEMAVTVSERLRALSVASALQAGIGCVESARERKKPVKATIAASRLAHPESWLGRKKFCVFIQLLCCCFSGTYTLLILNILCLEFIMNLLIMKSPHMKSYN